MRIAYLLPDPGIPVGGTKGASVHVTALCEALAEKGATVTLFAPTVTGPTPKGVSTIHVDIGATKSGPEGEVLRMKAIEKFYGHVHEHLRSNPHDAIHERLSLFADGGCLSAQLGIPRLVEVNAPVADERSAHFGLEHYDRAKACERMALLNSVVVAVSMPLAKWSLSLGAKRAVSIPNGANTRLFEPSRWREDGLRIREQEGLEELTVIGFAGSLKPWHGLDIFMESLAILGKEENVGALILGDGPGMESLLEKGAELPATVRFCAVGAVAQIEVPKYLAALDISVAPYLPAEPFYFSPLKIAEYMASGLPVVASNSESVRDMLGSSGILVEPGDAGSLAEALLTLIRDGEKRSALSRSALERARNTLDWSLVAERVLNEIRSADTAEAKTGGRKA